MTKAELFNLLLKTSIEGGVCPHDIGLNDLHIVAIQHRIQRKHGYCVHSCRYFKSTPPDHIDLMVHRNCWLEAIRNKEMEQK